MSERQAIVHPPSETGGRLVRIADRSYGTGHTPCDLTLFPHYAGPPGRDELHEGATEVRPP
ncbi:hypothetical protein ACIP2Y_08180 [Streptomyces sviceus]|uniref:hypothetical protein n=1 Tax=Streptomyces sviceus TaxID=285530 RepID=UPI0037FC6853